MSALPIITVGSFSSPEVEEEFRRASLVEDLKLVRLLILLIAIAIPIFLLNDWALYGGTALFPVVLVIRLVAVLFTAVLFFRLRNAITPRALDGWLLVWSGIMLFLLLFSLATRPVYLMNHAISVLAIMMASMLVPMRFLFQAWSATLFALAAMGLFVSKEPGSFMRLEILVGLTLAVMVGLMSSDRLHRSRRETFLAHSIERQAIGELEEAVAKVRKLEGILPICAWCKKIRREEGDWTGLETYMSEHTETQFSHGMCPDCLKKHYPEILA